MHKDALSAKIEKALREGDGNLIWRAFDHNRPPKSADETELFNDPYFVREVERVIEQNRLSIATANSRFVLRRVLEKFKAKNRSQLIGGFTVPII